MSQIATIINERSATITVEGPAGLDANSLQELIAFFGEDVVFAWASAQAIIAFRASIRNKASLKNKDTEEYKHSITEIAEEDWASWKPVLRAPRDPKSEFEKLILKFKTTDAAMAALTGMGMSASRDAIDAIFIKYAGEEE